jgi:hypothetical protein
MGDGGGGGRGMMGWGRRAFCRDISTVGTFVTILHTYVSEGDTVK